MIEKNLVARDEHDYFAFPDVALTRSGRLICVFLACVSHHDRSYSAVKMTSSPDRGKTWSQPVTIIEAEGEPYWNCPRVTCLPDGRLVVVCEKVQGDENLTAGQAPVYLWFSGDEGASWHGPLETPIRGIVPDRLLQLSSGRWLVACHSPRTDTEFLRQQVWLSDDQGTKWSGPYTVAEQEGLHLCEASLVELADKTVIAYMRENSGEGRDAYKAISRDGGQTWIGPFRTPLPGCHRPVAGLLEDGNLLITYRFMQGPWGRWGWGYQSFMAALTSARSAVETKRSAQFARICPLDYDRSPVADTGYSGWVQFPDGDLLAVNYIVDDWQRGQIRSYRFSVRDIILTD